ncbi:MAG: hypothetical protein WBI29_00505 [Candidatus Saccharimonadales bacterium]
MNENKKKILIIFGAIIIVIVIAIGAVFALKALQVDTPNSPVVTNETADALKNRAIETLNTDKDKAKDLFEEAKTQYEKLNDQDNVIDMEAQIYLIDHPVKSK